VLDAVACNSFGLQLRKLTFLARLIVSINIL